MKRIKYHGVNIRGYVVVKHTKSGRYWYKTGCECPRFSTDIQNACLYTNIYFVQLPDNGYSFEPVVLDILR